MTGKPRILFAVGSQKPAESNSRSLADYLAEQLRKRGVPSKQIHILPLVRGEERWNELFAAVDEADFLFLVFPLFVDSQPWSVVRFMELVGAHRRSSHAGPMRLAALVNSGFPEARHNEPALAICRQFAVESNMSWAGGLALGSGPVIGGKPLPDAGRTVRPVMKALDMVADALAEGRDIPAEAIALMARPLMPHWVYRSVATLGLWWTARKNGVSEKLRARPFTSPAEP